MKYDSVSGWAAPFVDEETGEVFEEPRNVTPPKQPLWLWHREQIAKAEARKRSHAEKARAYAMRAFSLFVVALLPLWHWIRIPAAILAVIAGLMAWIHAELWNVARFESAQRLDD